MRILVLSDIHARIANSLEGEKPDAPPPQHTGNSSWVTYRARESGFRDPLLTLRELIKSEKIEVDAIVAPGDLCDRADLAAFSRTWGELEEIRTLTKAKLLMGTAGNHDVDSRYQHGKVPNEYLATHSPPFPIGDEQIANEYWARGIAQAIVDDCRFVLVNSCCAHTRDSELENGHVTTLMCDAVAKLDEDKYKINVLVCHHHPARIPGLRGSDRQVIENGDRLFDVLEKSSQRWLVIHGHRHWAYLWYSGGSEISTPVLAAGSVGAQLPPDYLNFTSNQCHLVTLSVGNGALQDALLGKIRTWSYHPEIGWGNGELDRNLPPVTGFGASQNPRTLAAQLGQAVAKSGGVVDHQQLLRDFPALAHIDPQGQRKLEAILETDHDLSLRRSSEGELEIARRT